MNIFLKTKNTRKHAAPRGLDNAVRIGGGACRGWCVDGAPLLQTAYVWAATQVLLFWVCRLRILLLP